MDSRTLMVAFACGVDVSIVFERAPAMLISTHILCRYLCERMHVEDGDCVVACLVDWSYLACHGHVSCA